MGVVTRILKKSMYPANSLLKQHSYGFGSNSINDSSLGVLYSQAVRLHTKSHLQIFSMMGMFVVANFLENFSSVDRKGPGGNVQSVQVTKNLPYKCTQYILYVLHPLDNPARLVHADHWSYSHDL